MKFLQKLGKSLMIPVSVLPICGILIGIGYLICPNAMQGGSFSGLADNIGYILVKVGTAVVDNMAWLFVIGVSMGMSEDNHGASCLSGLVSWLIIISLLSEGFVVTLLPQLAEDEIVMTAFQKIQNPFIAILAGIIGAYCYNKYHGVELPKSLAFFSGRRFAPIMSALFSVAASLILFFIWPVAFKGLVLFGRKIVGMGAVGVGVYAFLNRLLIPLGLHHALNSVFWFDTIGIGDLTSYWSGLTSEEVGWSLGMYMSGFFPCMMFGVPGAMLAIIRSSKNRKAAFSKLLPSGICVLLSGVTEPFEYSFMFNAFPLYIVYSLLYGVVSAVTYLTGFRAGFAFSAGTIDLVLSSSMPAASDTWLIIPLGILAFVLFYIVFRLMLRIFKYDIGADSPANTDTGSYHEMALNLIRALGGKNNIVNTDCCATRLRLSVVSTGVIDEEAVKAAGAPGYVKTGADTCQVIIGTTVQQVCDAINNELKGKATKDSNTNSHITATSAINARAVHIEWSENQSDNVKHTDAVFDIFNSENTGIADITKCDDGYLLEYTVEAENGIHARPSAQLCTLIAESGCDVTIRANDKSVSGNSVADIMALGIVKGTKISINAKGKGAESLLHEIYLTLNTETVSVDETLTSVSYDMNYAYGRLIIMSETNAPEKKQISDTAAEKTRIAEAFEKLSEEYSCLIKKVGEDSQSENILKAKLMLISDASYVGEINEYIDKQKVNAEYAADKVSEAYAERMKSSGDEYLAARGTDFKDIARRICNILGQTKTENPFTQKGIYFGNEFTPEQIAGADRSNILGIVMENGSPLSHLAIVCSNYNIPFIYDAVTDNEELNKAKYAAIDGPNGFIISPDEECIQRVTKKADAARELRDKENEAADCTRRRVKVMANIAGPKDINDEIIRDADGIGLFRTEFLYMNRDSLPTEDEQYEAYRTVLEALNGKTVIIRTMDIGADKKCRCLDMPAEENPALGRRAIRICLQDEELFETQLRALLRSAVYGNLGIMYPMITSEKELDEIQKCVDRAAKELEKRGAAYRIPRLGIMIETPAAALISDRLARKVDFFSIGTNDLTQYTIALDRTARGLSEFYDPHHEAVMRLIETVVSNAHNAGIKVGICGELGADMGIIQRLEAMGIDELSMAPSKIRQAKSLLSKVGALKDDVKSGVLYSPADGKLIPMRKISDDAFASGMFGKCIGIETDINNDSSVIYSPCDGTVTMVARSGHAIGIRDEYNNEILIHVGIDTVRMNGKGFNPRVKEGDSVKCGDILMNYDIVSIKEAGYNSIVIMAVKSGGEK